MLKKERAAHLLRRLEDLYPETPIPLDHKDPYTLLVAVLLSAQCTDLRVNLVTPALFGLADNPVEMMKVPVPAIQAIIRPCGLSPTKAAAISNLSRILVEKHAGRVPQSFEALEELPGVGHKTASVVMAQSFGVPGLPGRYPHSPACETLETHSREKRNSDRTGSEAAFPKGSLEQTPSSDHFLWARILHCQRMRREILSPLQRTFPS